MAVLDWISPESAPHLDGGAVRLRPPRMSDHREWAELRAASRCFLQPWEPIWPADDLTRPAFRRRLAVYQKEQDQGVGCAYFVFRRSDGALVGGVNLRNIVRGVAQMGALGYWAGLSHVRRGYTLDAVRTVSRFAFGPFGLHRLEAACCPDNAPSRGLLLKAGFELEGRAKAYLKINGVWRDHLLFGIVRSEIPGTP